MIRKTLLIVNILSLMLILGCQEGKKSASFVEDIKQIQSRELKNSIVATCEGCNTYMDFYSTPRDIVIARNPAIDNQQLYLTVTDDEGKMVTCCEKPMRVMVDTDGKLYLYCAGCGKVKPIKVEDDKVMVVESN